MTKDEIQEINEQLNFSRYTRSNIQSLGNEIADITGKIELSSGMVEEGLLDVEVYKKFVSRKKIRIKDILTEIYAYLKLEHVNGNYDFVFKKEKV